MGLRKRITNSRRAVSREECLGIIMRFVIPVVFYEITNVERVYSSNTTIFIGRI
jgi:hypothetical protein